MELNWTTFILEVLNFFVLIWLLTRFFYRPVKKVIESRKKDIELKMHDADEIQQKAHELEAKYRNRIEDWEREKEELRSSFMEDLEKEKQTIYKRFSQQMDGEREHMIEQEKQKNEETVMKAQSEAFSISLKFVSKLLERLSGPDLEKKLIALTIEQLSSDNLVKSVHNIGENYETLKVVCRSAFQLDTDQRNIITEKIKEIFQKELSLNFEQDSTLISGIEIMLGSYVIQANLKSELQFFAQTERT